MSITDSTLYAFIEVKTTIIGFVVIYFMKPTKKIFAIGVLVILLLWFSSNTILYLSTKNKLLNTYFKPETAHYINKTPQNLSFKGVAAAGPMIALMGMEIYFPYSEDSIKYIEPEFRDGKITFLGIKPKNQNLFRFALISNKEELETLPYEPHLLNRVFCDKYITDSYYDSVRQIHNISLDDFSLWNLPCNKEMLSLLAIKGISVGNWEQVEMYYFNGRYLSGFLLVKKIEKDADSNNVEYIFMLADHSILINFVGVKDSHMETVMDIISSIRPHKEETAKVTQESSDLTAYSYELALLSEISRQGVSKKALSDLVKIMEEKQYKADIINRTVLLLESIE